MKPVWILLTAFVVLPIFSLTVVVGFVFSYYAISELRRLVRDLHDEHELLEEDDRAEEEWWGRR